MSKEIKMKDKDGYVYPLSKIIYVGSQVIHPGKSGKGEVSKVTLIDGYNYSIIDSIFNGINIPNGYHREYKVTVIGRTQGAGTINLSLNNIELFSINTYSAEQFKVMRGSNRFKETDIVLEWPTHHQQQKGINLRYEVTNSNIGDWSFENVTVHGYLVAN